MSVRIRPATPDDASALVAVHHEAVEALSGAQYSEEERNAWIRFVTEEAMRQGVSTAEAIAFVAETDETVVGFSTLHGQEVRAVYVHPAAQNRGVGTDLLRAVEAEARARDVQTLTVSASLNAIGFYDAHGYERVGEGTVELDESHEIRCVEMEKALSPQSSRSK